MLANRIQYLFTLMSRVVSRKILLPGSEWKQCIRFQILLNCWRWERKAHNDMSKCVKWLCCQQWLGLGSQVSSQVYTLAVPLRHAGVRLEYRLVPNALVSSEIRALRQTGAVLSTQLGLRPDNWCWPVSWDLLCWRSVWVFPLSLMKLISHLTQITTSSVLLVELIWFNLKTWSTLELL